MSPEKASSDSETRRDPPQSSTAELDASPNAELAALLLAFFRKRLRVDSDHVPHSGLAHVLARRTLERIARQRASENAPTDEGGSSPGRPQKAEVMRAALVELRALDAAARPDDTGPIVFRN